MLTTRSDGPASSALRFGPVTGTASDPSAFNRSEQLAYSGSVKLVDPRGQNGLWSGIALFGVGPYVDLSIIAEIQIGSRWDTERISEIRLFTSEDGWQTITLANDLAVGDWYNWKYRQCRKMTKSVFSLKDSKS